MISVTDLRPGTKVKMEGGLWECVEYQHQKIGRGGAKVVAKFKNLETGATVERTFNSGEKLEDIYVETRELQYLYQEGNDLVFMDLETYEQFHLPKDQVEAARFLKEGMTVLGDMYEGRPLKITPPTVVELKVVDTPPGVRGGYGFRREQARHLGNGSGGAGAPFRGARRGHQGGYPHGPVRGSGLEQPTKGPGWIPGPPWLRLILTGYKSRFGSTWGKLYAARCTHDAQGAETDPAGPGGARGERAHPGNP